MIGTTEYGTPVNLVVLEDLLLSVNKDVVDLLGQSITIPCPTLIPGPEIPSLWDLPKSRKRTLFSFRAMETNIHLVASSIAAGYCIGIRTMRMSQRKLLSVTLV